MKSRRDYRRVGECYFKQFLFSLFLISLPIFEAKSDEKTVMGPQYNWYKVNQPRIFAMRGLI